eukprot:TRINITY_DN5793_c0_g1_i1.p1 TRINITY_DN5793_c0_g1~~TRINITY_DN5793_c0_g1_i1.p1  ORF type:complete len:192 (-),score=19.25 TRINITY_DN5793_c0_g1_i1:106-654(-)
MVKINRKSIGIGFIMCLMVFCFFQGRQNLEKQTQLLIKRGTISSNIIFWSPTVENEKPEDEDPSKQWVETLSLRPHISVYHSFLTPEECDEIIELGREHVARSEVATKSETDFSAVNDVRTSNGMFFIKEFMMKSPLLRDVEKRISAWTMIPRENCEDFNMLRYEKGQQYMAHVGKNHQMNN